MGRGHLSRMFWLSAALINQRTVAQPGGALGSFSASSTSSGFGAAGLADAMPMELASDDVSDLLYDGDEDAGGSMGALAEIDADEDLSSKEKWKRMKGCLTAARRYIGANSDLVGAAVSTLASQSAPPGQAMSPEQIENSIVFAMILNCYQNVDDATAALVDRGDTITTDKAEKLFGKIGEPAPRPSPTQYKMLDKAMRQEQARALLDAQRDGAVEGAMGIGIPMLQQPTSQAAYALFIGALIFGSGLYALRRIVHSEGRSEGKRAIRIRTDKAQAKIDKAEERLKRKMK